MNWGMKKWLKALRRRKGKNVRPEPTADITVAEKLIMNQWGITFSNPEPPRDGAKRAAERIRRQQEFQGDVKSKVGVTRQMARARMRRRLKNERSKLKEMIMAEKGIGGSSIVR